MHVDAAMNSCGRQAAFRLKGKSNFLRWGVPPPTQRTVRRGTPQIAIRVKAASSIR